MHEWRLSGSVRNLGTEALTQKPTSSNHRLPLTAFETHNGRSTFAAGTALHVESPGGLSPPGAPRSVREPLDSYGSRCSAVSHGRAASGQRALDWLGAAG